MRLRTIVLALLTPVAIITLGYVRMVTDWISFVDDAMED